jgi:hypothetical protein
MTKMSDQQAGVASTTGTLLTFGFFILSQITLGDAALTVTILTGLTTIGLNVQKFFQNKKYKNRDL